LSREKEVLYIVVQLSRANWVRLLRKQGKTLDDLQPQNKKRKKVEPERCRHCCPSSKSVKTKKKTGQLGKKKRDARKFGGCRTKKKQSLNGTREWVGRGGDPQHLGKRNLGKEQNNANEKEKVF